jgi:hypothetical protein
MGKEKVGVGKQSWKKPYNAGLMGYFPVKELKEGLCWRK